MQRSVLRQKEYRIVEATIRKHLCQCLTAWTEPLKKPHLGKVQMKNSSSGLCNLSPWFAGGTDMMSRGSGMRMMDKENEKSRVEHLGVRATRLFYVSKASEALLSQFLILAHTTQETASERREMRKTDRQSALISRPT